MLGATTSHIEVIHSNNNFCTVAIGLGRVKVPLWYIVSHKSGKVIHMGKRKHIVEMWNTRYKFWGGNPVMDTLANQSQ